ncbi:hypothetical protein H5410_038751 [Solanum commersonii]|uniref:Uncharacterized protein n=1 Tax=Solanum commersonii TaxID=4109 RepID=A0A9J5YCA3_SOLCO|nr:hypothetical protein H5410_038751 [Solanum commersonii]
MKDEQQTKSEFVINCDSDKFERPPLLYVVQSSSQVDELKFWTLDFHKELINNSRKLVSIASPVCQETNEAEAQLFLTINRLLIVTGKIASFEKLE